jgi:hypothetical protein
MCQQTYEDKWGKYLKALETFFEAEGYFADAKNVKGTFLIVFLPSKYLYDRFFTFSNSIQ